MCYCASSMQKVCEWNRQVPVTHLIVLLHKRHPVVHHVVISWSLLTKLRCEPWLTLCSELSTNHPLWMKFCMQKLSWKIAHNILNPSHALEKTSLMLVSTPYMSTAEVDRKITTVKGRAIIFSRMSAVTGNHFKKRNHLRVLFFYEAERCKKALSCVVNNEEHNSWPYATVEE